MFFVVTTGRSGSKALAQTLSQHPLCQCSHEPHPILIKLAMEFCHGDISKEELETYLFQPESIFPHRRGLKLYGESDQKLSYMIPVLSQLGTHARFIWLVRDGRNVVSSTYARGWYDGCELNHPRQRWAKYRIQGDACGDVRSDTWPRMSQFAKCCWYWSYTNRTIATSLAGLPSVRWKMVRLEELTDHLRKIFSFLNLPYLPLQPVHSNRSPNAVRRHETWTDKETATFENICGAEMDLCYPGWREDRFSDHTVNPCAAEIVRAGLSWPSATSHVTWFLAKLSRRALRWHADSRPGSVARLSRDTE